MKVLVLSDSHGCADRLRAVLTLHPECKTVFFLGDGLGDLLAVRDAFCDRAFYAVRGNNDWERRFDDFDDTVYRHIEGHTILATHGHRDHVRFSLSDLAHRTEAVRGDVALFGHTHRPTQVFVPGTMVLAVNPGALCNGQYAVLDIEKSGVEATFHTV